MAERTIYFAKITRQPQRRLFDTDFHHDLLAALIPAQHVTRYHRDWRFSRPTEIGTDFITGKLGFVRRAPTAATTYDDAIQDFVTTQALADEGSFTMYAVDTNREVVAFEDRPPDIRRQSFVGAFRALLDENDFPAAVEPLTDPNDFDRWAASVDRVVRVRAVVHSPNPEWHAGAELVRRIVQESAAERAEVVAVARPDTGLDARAPWIDGALQQVAEHGQGKVSATGVARGIKTTWESWTRLRTSTIHENETTTPQQVWEWLLSKLRDLHDE